MRAFLYTSYSILGNPYQPTNIKSECDKSPVSFVALKNGNGGSVPRLAKSFGFLVHFLRRETERPNQKRERHKQLGLSPCPVAVTTRIIVFLVVDPNLNLHLPLASWDGGFVPNKQHNKVFSHEAVATLVFPESLCIFFCPAVS